MQTAPTWNARAAAEAAVEWSQDMAAEYEGGQRNFDEMHESAALYAAAGQIIAEAAEKVARLIEQARTGRATRGPIDIADLAERMAEGGLDPLLQSGAYPLAVAGLRSGRLAVAA